MKALFISVCMLGVIAPLRSQDYSIRTAFVQFHSVDQDETNLSDTFGESIVGSSTQQGTILISGFYAGILSDSTTSVVESPGITGIEAYPNPVVDGLMIESTSIRPGDYLVSICAMDGKVVKSLKWTLDEPAILVDCRGLLPGQYILQVQEPESGRQYSARLTRK